MTIEKLTDATLTFLKTDEGTFVLLPLGNSTYIPPTTPYGVTATYSIHFPEEWEFEYDEDDLIKDSASPSTYAARFIGGRPFGR